MKTKEALSLLGLSNQPYTPIEVDRAFYKNNTSSPSEDGVRAVEELMIDKETPDRESHTHVDTREIWDSLILEWVHIPEPCIDDLSERELYEMRRKRLIANHASDFQIAIETDFPNRLSYPWDDETVFADMGSLISLEHIAALSNDELLVDTVVRAKISRARFRALFIDPTRLWIQGTYLEEADGNCYRLRYPEEVEDVLVRISNIYGGCGLLNALRILILRSGVAFDNDGHILGEELGKAELSVNDVRKVFYGILASHDVYGHPFQWRAGSNRAEVNGVECVPICYIPIYLRTFFIDEADSSNREFRDETGFAGYLVDCWNSNQIHWFFPNSKIAQQTTIKNAIRALYELDGEQTDPYKIGNEILSKREEAKYCLMHNPSCMLSDSSDFQREKLYEEYAQYSESQNQHKQSYSNWCWHQFQSTFGTVKNAVGKFFEGAAAAGFVSVFIIPLYMSAFLNLPQSEFDKVWFLAVLVTSIFFGVLCAVWNRFSWPIDLWWDKLIKKAPIQIRWALEIRVLAWALFAAVIAGAVIPFIFGIIAVGIFKIWTLNSVDSWKEVVIASFVLTFVLILIIQGKPGFNLPFRRRFRKTAPARSEWERRIASHVEQKYPNLRVETNDRTVIRSRTRFFEHYEIDIWLPEIKLGIEANGEQYHNRFAYERDKKNGTMYSKEMYKEKYCANKGIKLVHVWSSENIDKIYSQIDKEIRLRM